MAAPTRFGQNAFSPSIHSCSACVRCFHQNFGRSVPQHSEQQARLSLAKPVMQILMEFLQLTADEVRALAQFAPQLLGRLDAFATTLGEHIDAQALDDGGLAALG